jgi:hypothetical protein
MRPSGPRRGARGTAPANASVRVSNIELYTMCSILMTRHLGKIILHLFKTGKVIVIRLGDSSYLYQYNNVK